METENCAEIDLEGKCTKCNKDFYLDKDLDKCFPIEEAFLKHEPNCLIWANMDEC